MQAPPAAACRSRGKEKVLPMRGEKACRRRRRGCLQREAVEVREMN